MVCGDALGERVSMDPEDFGGICEVLPVAGQGLFNIDLLKLSDRFIQKNLTVEHFVNQGFELGAHLHGQEPGNVKAVRLACDSANTFRRETKDPFP